MKLNAALGEAIFMMGMENNSDIVNRGKDAQKVYIKFTEGLYVPAFSLNILRLNVDFFTIIWCFR